MSRDILDDETILVTGFAGGRGRGWSYQINDNVTYVQFTMKEAEKIAKAILKDIRSVKNKKKAKP